MTFARNLIRDLVAKRLWPLALALVLAIIAIPLALGGGGTTGSPSSDLVNAPLAPAAPAGTPIELVGPTSARSRGGKLVDPFRRPANKTAQTPTTTSTSGDSGAGGETTPDQGATGATTHNQGATSAPLVGSDPPSPERSRSVYRTTVQWSSVAPAKARRLARLTPLGGLLNPALLYLGVANDRKHALFLLGPRATSTGEAGCPDAECRVIALVRGESQIVDLQSAGAEASQFELEIVSVKRDQLSSGAVAARARAKEHPDGRDILRSLLEHRPIADIMGNYAYDRDEGVMVRAGGESAKEPG